MTTKPKQEERADARLVVYVEPDLVLQLDELRGLASRSAFIKQLIIDRIHERRTRHGK